MATSELKVQSAQVIVLRLFDLAYEISLKEAETLWSKSSSGASVRNRLLGTPTKAVSFGVPPLTLELGSVVLEIGGVPQTMAASVRLYDFGIAALALRLPVANLAWSEFSQLANHADQAIGPAAPCDIWNQLLVRLRNLLGGALDRPTALPLQEDYLMAVVDSSDETISADTLLDRVDLTHLLSGETRPLSAGAKQDLLRQRFSYHPDDLAVITWDRAFIYDPQRESDVADVLEMANAQLLEIRTYDEMLDDELPRMRDMVESARRRTNLLASRRYARLARRLYTLVAEVSELTERVDNALQVTEDVYLARVYSAAIDLFKVSTVSAAVDRKLAIIRETYTALHSEAEGSRSELLEIAILALIAVEIVLSLIRH